MSLQVGIRWNTLQRWSKLAELERRERSDALTEELQTIVQNFYLRSYISTAQPDRKSARRDLQPRHVLNKSLKRTYDEFNTENKSDRNISFSKFSKMRPKAVQTLNTAKFRFCLYERCINMEMKLKAINLKMCNKSRHRQVRGQPHDSLWPLGAWVIRHSRYDACPSIMWPMWDAKTSKVSMWETVYFPTWKCGI